MIQGEPLHVKTLLFDLLVGIGTFILSGFVGAVISIKLTESREEGLGISLFVTLPVWTVLFYLIRRRFDFLRTVLQILITIAATFGFSYLFVVLLWYLPDYAGNEMAYIIPIFALIVFILSKHVSDLYLIKKEASA